MNEIALELTSIDQESGGKLLYPGIVTACGVGQCYRAVRMIEVGTVVERFFGRDVRWEEVGEEDICYAACCGTGIWTIPTTNARYINHSCDPNCDINSDGEVYAIRSIEAGEEITFDYVTISKKRYQEAPQEYFWHDRWSFDCACGSANCHRRIDHYIIRDE